MKQFIIKIIVVSLIIAFIGWLVFGLFIPQYYLPVLPYTLMFFATVTIFVHAWQLKMAKKDIGKFTRNSMLVTFFKLLIYSVFTVIYISFRHENVLVFVVCVMLLYLIFTFIEVMELTKASQKK